MAKDELGFVLQQCDSLVFNHHVSRLHVVAYIKDGTTRG